MSNISQRIIYLARHGETEWNRIGRWQGSTDIPLSEVGRAQARSLAHRLRDRGIGRVHASQLSRALETSQIVAAHLELPAPLGDARLQERGYGAFEGLTREQCAERFPDVWERYLADRRALPPGAEPQPSVVGRITAALTEIASHDSPASVGSAVLVVSHGGIIRSFLHHATGVVPAPLENGAMFRLQFQGGVLLSAELDAV